MNNEWKIYVSITMNVKKLATIYETYVWLLRIWNDLLKIIIERMYVLHNVQFHFCKFQTN
jgi:hypothetical protein